MDEELILGRYRPLQELGEGGHGQVTLAYDTKMQRRVAVKRIPLPRDAFAETATRAALKEARTSALLNHPNIVVVHEWESDQDEAFLIMEHVDGASVADLLEQEGRLTSEETAAIMSALGEALSFAHSNGVLHLDIKPENVLVTRDGLVKVADFGIATLTDAMGHAFGTAGTPGFMAPEQLEGHPLDERTDEWAVAVLACLLLTGVEPFPRTLDADDVRHAYYAPADEEGLEGAFASSELPRVTVDVLAGALSPIPEERYPSVRDFIDALLPRLRDAQRGRRSLAALVTEIAEEESWDERGAGGMGDWLASHRAHFLRLGAAAASALLGYVGIQPYGLGIQAAFGATGFLALTGALAPALGLAVGLMAFAAGMFSAGLGWGLGATAVGVAYWLSLGRRGRWEGVGPLVAPLLGMLRAAPGVPLLAGASAAPVTASVSSALAGLTTIAFSAASGSPPPFAFVSSRILAKGPVASLTSAWPRPDLSMAAAILLTTLAWAGAGALSSLAFRSRTRAGFVGLLLASSAALGLGYAVWPAILPAVQAKAVLQQVFGSLILLFGVVAAGLPDEDGDGNK